MASCCGQAKDGSDKMCVESCGLKYGISEVFNQNVVEQQKVKQSKAHIKPQIFDDQNEQTKFDHLMNDLLFKTFDNDSEKKILQKALQGFESNYSEILNGTEKNMMFFPNAFNFDSRIGPTETSVPGALEKMQVALEGKPNLTDKEEANLKTIRDH